MQNSHHNHLVFIAIIFLVTKATPATMINIAMMMSLMTLSSFTSSQHTLTPARRLDQWGCLIKMG